MMINGCGSLHSCILQAKNSSCVCVCERMWKVSEIMAVLASHMDENQPDNKDSQHHVITCVLRGNLSLEATGCNRENNMGNDKQSTVAMQKFDMVRLETKLFQERVRWAVSKPYPSVAATFLVELGIHVRIEGMEIPYLAASGWSLLIPPVSLIIWDSQMSSTILKQHEAVIVINVHHSVLANSLLVVIPCSWLPKVVFTPISPPPSTFLPTMMDLDGPIEIPNSQWS